jgi:hypothetical protein
MDYIGVSMGIGGAIRRSIMGIGEGVVKATLDVTSSVGSLHHNSGETNRYTKHHIQRVITKEPVISRPVKFASLSCKPYEHLELASERHIRLLSLIPASDPEALVMCKIEEVELGTNPKYDALSYTWGVLPRDYPILIIHNSKVPVDHALFASPSLYAVLKQLTTRERAPAVD